MSSCGGKCGCGTGCSCGDGCKGCNMYPDLSFGEKSIERPVLFLSTSSDMGYVDESVTVAGENGCKCGSNCTCDPCNCK